MLDWVTPDVLNQVEQAAMSFLPFLATLLRLGDDAKAARLNFMQSRQCANPTYHEPKFVDSGALPPAQHSGAGVVVHLATLGQGFETMGRVMHGTGLRWLRSL